MLTFTFSIDDINQDTARQAFSATSFSPEKRGELYRQDYVNHMQGVKETFARWATAENAAAMSQDLEAYRQKYVQLLTAYLHAHSRVMSPMITGPANFPTRTNTKRSNTADKRRAELLLWSQKRLDKLRRKYDPRYIERRPIMTGDADALDRLRQKLAALEAYHQQMKAMNKIVKNPRFKQLPREEQTQKLIEEHGYKPETAHQLTEPDFMGSIGVPAYRLTNNAAEIRRIKSRITELERLQTQETSSEARADGIEIERDPDAARIRLIFPDKPDQATRTLLKQHGFRWAPSLGAWQRQLNSNGETALRAVLSKIDQMQ